MSAPSPLGEWGWGGDDGTVSANEIWEAGAYETPPRLLLCFLKIHCSLLQATERLGIANCACAASGIVLKQTMNVPLLCFSCADRLPAGTRLVLLLDPNVSERRHAAGVSLLMPWRLPHASHCAPPAAAPRGSGGCGGIGTAAAPRPAAARHLSTSAMAPRVASSRHGSPTTCTPAGSPAVPRSAAAASASQESAPRASAEGQPPPHQKWSLLVTSSGLAFSR